MNLGPNRGVSDNRSLLGDDQYLARRQLVLFSIHWMMWMSTQRRLGKSLRFNLNQKTDNLRGPARPDELFWSPELISLQHCTS